MSKELVIGSNRHETRVAILEEDQLVEVYFQRGNEYSLAGSIHKGRVTRVLPGMQSAFVDLGLERDTFLYVTDFFEENEDIDTVEEKPTRGERRDRQPRFIKAAEERPPEPREVPVETPEALEQQGGEAAEEEAAPPVAELVPAADSSETRTPDRADPERGFRGDRRGRRSRRRRQRGRGFPENKYAQPALSRPVAPAVRPDSAPEPADQPKEDVIILPGESLAKYRRPAEADAGLSVERDNAQDSPPARAQTEEPELSPEVLEIAEEEAAEHEAIEEEAEEIALTDKVFGHNDDLSPKAEEEKIEEVKQDQPIPESSEEAPRDPALDLSPANAGSQVIEMPRRDEPPFQPPASSEFAVQDLYQHPESADDPEIEEPESPASAAPLSPGETPRAQTAELREPAARYLHRVPRRMRRRRGGNRFPAQESSSFRAQADAAGPTAVAAAMQPERRPEPRREPDEDRSLEKPDRAEPSIADLLKPGQEIIVQIAKEPLGQKGARITSHVALPGRYVVFMPSVNHLGVSRKIASDEERQRLKRILQAHRVGTTGGFIVRTAGEGVPEDEIAADMNFLYTLWLDIRQKAEKKPAPALLHYDLDIVQRLLRDQVTEEFKAIWVDSEDLYENVVTFMQRFQPALVNRVKMYTRPAPIFDAFNITQELERALRPKVWLKSGGYIVINQTEALVAIDINTGKYVGKSNRLEDTIVKTNTEAVKEIVRQMRLRDLGGIIVVDFIDMDERRNRQKVMQALEEAMRADRAPYKILQFNDFGLVAITRKRVKQSLERTLCSPCPYCDGAGYVKSVQTVIGEILIEAQKIAKAIEGKDVVLRVHPDIAKVLKASDNRFLEELEEVLKRPVLVRGDPMLHHEKFDLG
jgi:ribonuclease G